MKILSAQQTHTVDRATIEQEPIDSIDLMERASGTFVQWFKERFTDQDRTVHIFCGSGNNGGDGLAVARLLHEAAYPVVAYDCRIGQESDDRRTNRERLAAKRVIECHTLHAGAPLPRLPENIVIIDAIFGSGLDRPVEGYWAQLIGHLNTAVATRVAIDIPSGIRADAHSEAAQFAADHTLSFELPKLAFFMPENGDRVGAWTVRSIGLYQPAIDELDTPFRYLTAASCRSLLIRRRPYDHKGTFGHAHIIAGSYGKMGACTLCARAVLRAGAGLVTVHAPRCGYEILQIAFPEAMVVVDEHKYVFSQIGEIGTYDSIGIGPGLGKNQLTVAALQHLLQKTEQPLVLDADALNIISEQPDLFDLLPARSILTPHPKEFERLFGAAENDFSRLATLRRRAKELDCIVVLKTGSTAIALPDGTVWFNNTGNPGMGTAGAGDVLTGILTGLLAQGYAPAVAAQLGVYLHGLAGDLAAAELEQESLIAEDIIRYLGKAFKKLKNNGL